MEYGTSLSVRMSIQKLVLFTAITDNPILVCWSKYPRLCPEISINENPPLATAVSCLKLTFLSYFPLRTLTPQVESSTLQAPTNLHEARYTHKRKIPHT
ncbi:hypothetical protein L6164_030700 [Bauhinia variegata]|uniref:Uncharacterized protein n=1 Tax=Bauhinia variegata TaxID=167791 RepID=A0ACB9LDI2_BAUVA|nr:hypothetical protein L6164_030700 [Bauhinia variegata]